MFKKLFLLISFVSSLYSSKYILLLQSYNKDFAWSSNISKGIKESLNTFPNYELSTEYLDNKRNKNEKYHKLIREAFIEKFKKYKYDIVIAADNAAVEFVLENKNKLFKNTPLVFTGIEKKNPGIDINNVIKNKINLVLESKPLKSGIETILKVMPNLKYLYVINDKTYTSQMINKILKKELESYKQRIKYKLYLDGNISKIYEEIRNLPKNSAVWFGNLYLDEKENYIPYQEVNNLLNSSSVPVFAMTDYHLGKGIVGGHLLRGYYVGYEAGKIALDILNGKKVDYKNPVIAQREYVFDYKVMKKYNLDISLLPKNAILINQEKSFFEKYRYWIDRVFLAFPFIFIFFLIALFNIYKRHKLAKKLIALNKREQVLLNTIKSSVFWVDNNCLLRGYNYAFSEIFLKNKNENVLGKNINDVFKPLKKLTKENLETKQDIEFDYLGINYLQRNKVYYDENGKNSGIVTIITDITEKKQLEINKQFLIQQSKLAEVGEMLSSIAHQWKVPLIELSVVAHKMQRYYKKDKLSKKDMDSFFDTIMKQIIYMGNTIDEFREFVKPSNKAVEFDIDKGIKEIQTILEASMIYNNIQLNYINLLENNYVLFGYPNEFKQVLLNIINNAKDSIIDSRKNKNSSEIKVCLSRRTNKLNICVTDDGKGFSKEALTHIFEAFYSTKVNGDGFGLYMAKVIIENKMNGLIRASNTNNGAKIDIELPLNISKEKK